MKDPVCPLRLNLYGHPLAGLIWEKYLEEKLIECGFEKVRGWECMYQNKKEQTMLSVYVDDFKMAGKTQGVKNCWAAIAKKIDLDPPQNLSGNSYLGVAQEDIEPPMDLIEEKRLYWNRLYNKS